MSYTPDKTIRWRVVADRPTPNQRYVEHTRNGETLWFWIPVETVSIRWCKSHRRETWAGRTTCPGMGGSDLCKVVDASLEIGDGE